MHTSDQTIPWRASQWDGRQLLSYLNTFLVIICIRKWVHKCPNAICAILYSLRQWSIWLRYLVTIKPSIDRVYFRIKLQRLTISTYCWSTDIHATQRTHTHKLCFMLISMSLCQLNSSRRDPNHSNDPNRKNRKIKLNLARYLVGPTNMLSVDKIDLLFISAKCEQIKLWTINPNFICFHFHVNFAFMVWMETAEKSWLMFIFSVEIMLVLLQTTRIREKEHVFWHNQRNREKVLRSPRLHFCRCHRRHCKLVQTPTRCNSKILCVRALLRQQQTITTENTIIIIIIIVIIINNEKNFSVSHNAAKECVGAACTQNRSSSVLVAHVMCVRLQRVLPFQRISHSPNFELATTMETWYSCWCWAVEHRHSVATRVHHCMCILWKCASFVRRSHCATLCMHIWYTHKRSFALWLIYLIKH